MVPHIVINFKLSTRQSQLAKCALTIDVFSTVPSPLTYFQILRRQVSERPHSATNCTIANGGTVRGQSPRKKHSDFWSYLVQKTKNYCQLKNPHFNIYSHLIQLALKLSLGRGENFSRQIFWGAPSPRKSVYGPHIIPPSAVNASLWI